MLALYERAGNAKGDPASPSVPSDGLIAALRGLVRSWFAERDAVKANGHAHSYAPVDERGAAAGPEDDEDPDEYWKEGH